MELTPPAPTAPWDEVAARLRRLPRRRARGEGRRAAAVLVPLFVPPDLAPGADLRAALHAVFIRRPDAMRAHAGQVAFPGGVLEPGEEARDAALREAEEELGLPRALVTPLGPLHDIDTSTGFVMTPWVAAIPAGVAWAPSPEEVARVFTAPLAALARVEETHRWERAGAVWEGPAYPWEGETIWGATGRVVKDLLALLGPPT